MMLMMILNNPLIRALVAVMYFTAQSCLHVGNNFLWTKWWWFSVLVMSLGSSTKLLYARPGYYLDGWPSTDG